MVRVSVRVLLLLARVMSYHEIALSTDRVLVLRMTPLLILLLGNIRVLMSLLQRELRLVLRMGVLCCRNWLFIETLMELVVRRVRQRPVVQVLALRLLLGGEIADLD